MPIYQENIFHDRQVMGSSTPNDTTSLVFVDVPGAILTTKDLSQPANYMSWVSLLMAGSLNNTMATFRGTINDVPIGSEVPVVLRNKDADVGFVILGNIGNVSAGDEIKLQFKTDKGTLTIVEYAILIDGIPESRVVL